MFGIKISKEIIGTKLILQIGRSGIILSILCAVLLSPAVSNSITIVHEPFSVEAGIDYSTTNAISPDASNMAFLRYMPFESQDIGVSAITLSFSYCKLSDIVTGVGMFSIPEAPYFGGWGILTNEAKYCSNKER